MKAVVAAVWLTTFALTVASFWPGTSRFFVDSLTRHEWSLFAGSIVGIVLANRALATSRFLGDGGFRFYQHKPRWALVVQLLLFIAWVWLAFAGPGGRMHGDECLDTVQGQTVVLSIRDCRTLELRLVQFFLATWLNLGWLAVAQFALGQKLPSTPQKSGAI